jgi:hypothetical protein
VDTGNVVGIGEHGRYRPDFAGLASSQVGTARSKLRMSPDEFAVLLSGLVGWGGPSGSSRTLGVVCHSSR